jgi:glutamate synthase domain-containing protein 3
MVRVESVSREVDQRFLRAAIERHYHLTLSERARELLADWDQTLRRFKKVHPHPRLEEPTAVEQDDLCLEAKLLGDLLAADEAVSVEADADVMSAGV